MFYFAENQRAYLPAWEYNTCRMLGALAEIVKKNGGKVKPYRHVMANNRTYEPDAEPVQIYGQGYIRFSIGGDLYGFDINDNPFFEHYYTKLQIRPDGKVPRGCYVYAEELPRNVWMYDCLFRTATDDQIEQIAEIVYQTLIGMHYSRTDIVFQLAEVDF